MTVVAAAVCPHPPLLVPRVAGAEPVPVLGPAFDAVRQLLAVGPELVVVVGDAPRTGPYRDGAQGTLAGFGVDVRVVLSPAPTVPVVTATDDGGSTSTATSAVSEWLPLSITLGAWLLAESGWTGQRLGWGVAAGTTATEAAAVGERLAQATADRDVALLVMGDGSARRTLKAPGYLDERAAPHDAAVAAALATADVSALLALDPVLSRDLAAAGRASWQVLAGAAVARTSADTRTEPWSGRLLYDEAPYGVGYLVAVWERGVRSTWP